MRRTATFLLGAWMGGCLLLAFLQLQNLKAPNLVLNAPIAQAAKLVQALGQEQSRLLLRHFAAEQTRRYAELWEEIQLGLGLVTGALLYRGIRKQLLPMILCGMMIVFVIFQHFAITPELIYRGRETDFPPGNAALGPMARLWAMQQVYIGAEAVKLVIGGILASYLFVYRAPRRKKSVDSIDHTYHGHINR